MRASWSRTAPRYSHNARGESGFSARTTWWYVSVTNGSQRITNPVISKICTCVSAIWGSLGILTHLLRDEQARGIVPSGLDRADDECRQSGLYEDKWAQYRHAARPEAEEEHRESAGVCQQEEERAACNMGGQRS